ncbi:F0F1 ATP synthase subunit epsilon [Candidatus Cardinium hertigii]|uniref:ATP synthase epsilon chain n=1 Tax=Candidatus Cardinium hertigii TaxID=247481 RepID=A0A2Z3LDB5_9BACT|nr:F0F1 ATP synthase subunit epsilon [Candidatus Cardinium hertigii]AWN82112.1 ATP synthase epsilon chain [Candidatus Cardinium hertigii]
MHLSILTASQIVFNGTVQSVGLPGTVAPFQILAGHGPMVSSLMRGNITYAKEGNLYSFSIQHGFVSIARDQVKVVCAPVESTH